MRAILKHSVLMAVGFLCSMTSVQAVPIPGVFTTGVDDAGAVLQIGETDPHYVATGTSNQALVKTPDPSWMWITPPPGSAWIGAHSGNTPDLVGMYVYTLTFNLSTFDHTTARISGQWSSDNTSRIFLNEQDTGFARPEEGAFETLRDFTISSGFVSGQNTLSFSVTNLPCPGCVNPTGLLVANLTATATPLLDHFLSYTIKRSKGSAPFTPVPGLSLKDQFDTAPLLFDVLKVVRIYNPADKNSEGIIDPDTHLESYQIKLTRMSPPQPKPARHHVQVTNQFHTDHPLLLDTLKPDRLLVPTAKCIDQPGNPCPNPSAPPDPSTHNVDHFKCYTVKRSKGAARFQPILKVSIQDQFLANPKLFDLKRPTRLCTPVDKKGEGIKNPNQDLMCYKAVPSKGQPKHRAVKGIHLSNQFDQEKVESVKEDEFCVPSQKNVLASTVDADEVSGGDDADGGDDDVADEVGD